MAPSWDKTPYLSWHLTAGWYPTTTSIPTPPVASRLSQRGQKSLHLDLLTSVMRFNSFLKTTWLDYPGTVWLVLHYLRLHHRLAFHLLHLFLVSRSWAGMQGFSLERGSQIPEKNKQTGRARPRPYTEDDEGWVRVVVQLFPWLVSYVMRCSGRFSCCFLPPLVRLSGLSCTFLCWGYAVGFIPEGPGMTSFPLAERGGVFIAMGYFPNAAVVP